ncbi:g709 [Coccomyxa viridis]|uniref:G709 protein n=1 Tax=Coccomyxa viridis TaxID=1274662 RepID=A0ABP1FGI1_9CHLO
MPLTQAFRHSLRPPRLQHGTQVTGRKALIPSSVRNHYYREMHGTRLGKHHSVTCQAKKGFGAGGGKKSRKREWGPALEEDDPSWLRVGKLTDFKNGKQTRAVILPDNSAIVLYRTQEDEVYCSDANSTAYKFPMIDANVIERDGGPAAEVPLDGTVYDLETGKVLVWCPKNNPLRFVLGSLKSTADPQPLKMYPARVNSNGQIFARLAPT